MERPKNRSEFEGSNREALLSALRSIEFDGDDKPDFESLFDIAPELRDMDFGRYDPVFLYSVLEHSVRLAQLAKSDTVAIALLFRNIGKTLRQNWEQVESIIPGRFITKTPDYAREGAVIAEGVLTDREIVTDPAELGLILNIVRFCDSWDLDSDDNSDEIIASFNSETVEYLFEAQLFELGAHVKEYDDDYRTRLLAFQKKIRNAILAKEKD